MVLEAVMLCLDNSEFMRNGDYPPTRLDVQHEASNYIASMKNQANIENSVGVLTMAGKRIDVLLTPNSDLGNVMKALSGIQCAGISNFVSGLKTAQLCLKNRSNKNQRQRIIMFVGSPITNSLKELVKLGKNLKKNNVAVDVVNFGQENMENENTEKLDAFIQAVSSDNNSKMVGIPPGPHNFVDMIITTIMADEQGNLPPGAGAGGFIDGIDPSMDPELAEAIRMSLEAERERQNKMQVDGEGAAQPAAGASPAQPAPAATSEAAAANAEEEMDEETAMALAMSMEQFEADGDAIMKDPPVASTSPKPAEQKTATPAGPSQVGQALQDPNFVDDLLSDLNIPKDQVDIDDILSSLNDPNKKNDGKKDESKKPQ